MIADDRPRDSGFDGSRLQLAADDPAVGLSHPFEVDQLRVFVVENPVGSIPGRLADTDDDKALPLA